jgi:hypothetical protein
LARIEIVHQCDSHSYGGQWSRTNQTTLGEFLLDGDVLVLSGKKSCKERKEIREGGDALVHPVRRVRWRTFFPRLPRGGSDRADVDSWRHSDSGDEIQLAPALRHLSSVHALRSLSFDHTQASRWLFVLLAMTPALRLHLGFTGR